jgi:hypothetical protein
MRRKTAGQGHYLVRGILWPAIASDGIVKCCSGNPHPEDDVGMTMQDYVESLRSKHAHLERQIDDEMHRPLPDQSILSRLKREKLRIKDEMARLNGSEEHVAVSSGLH